MRVQFKGKSNVKGSGRGRPLYFKIIVKFKIKVKGNGQSVRSTRAQVFACQVDTGGGRAA